MYTIGLLLLIIMPLAIVILTSKYFLKKKDIDLSNIDRILLSLITSSFLSICYFIFDYYILKATDFIACSDWCGIENIFFSIFAGGIGVASLLILILKKGINKKNATNENNFTIAKKDLNIIYIISIIILINLIHNLFYSNIFQRAMSKDFFWFIWWLLEGPILENLHLIVLLSAVLFLKKSIIITKILTYISLFSVIFNYRYLFNVHFYVYFSIIEFLILILIIILIYYIFKTLNRRTYQKTDEIKNISSDKLQIT